MAGITQVVARLIDQLRILRVVGIMAGKAHPALERGVELIPSGF
jgi:hypothetical protein